MNDSYRVTSSERTRIFVKSLLGVALLAGALVAPQLSRAWQGDSNKKSSGTNAGITISEQATAKDIGLPMYPGAKLHKDPKDDSSSANLGLWGGSFGFKLVVLKMESTDGPDKIAAFYRRSLAKYGPVLDCSNAQASKPEDDQKSQKLTCGDDKPEAGGQVFKSGTKEKQHIVTVQKTASGSTFQMVYLEARTGDEEAK
jgi:hypothetical protein